MSPTVHALVGEVATTALRTPYVAHGAAVLAQAPLTQCPINGTRLPSAVALAKPTIHAGSPLKAVPPIGSIADRPAGKATGNQLSTHAAAAEVEPAASTGAAPGESEATSDSAATTALRAIRLSPPNSVISPDSVPRTVNTGATC